MLYDRKPPLKSYEELFMEAISQIPVYSSQWTNFNESDPGITILQNFAAFHQLQQESIFEVTEESRYSLFKLLGMEPLKDSCSQVMVEPEQMPETEYVIPVHEKLVAGEGVYYETDKHVHLKKKQLFRVFTAEDESGICDISTVLKKDIPVSLPVFGEEAKPEAAIYFCFHSLPGPSGDLSLYVKTDNKGERNPFRHKNVPPFARLCWQCYTDAGWENMKAWDKTGYFLSDGEIKLKLPVSKAAVWNGEHSPENCYAVRCVLKESCYDFPPGIFYITDCAFPAMQKKTVAASFLKCGTEISIHSSMVCDGYFQVFVKEEGEKDYRFYQRAGNQAKTGRYYRLLKEDDSSLLIQFDQDTFAYGPGDCQDAVRVVCYSEEIVHHRFIGTVYGYENQILNMNQIEHVLSESFELIAELKDREGKSRFRFIKPGDKNEDGLGYEILPVKGEIRVYNPGLGQECRLYLCNCAMTMGADGNLRTGAFLHTLAKRDLEINMFTSIGMLCHGCSAQTLKDMERCLELDMEAPTRAVTAKDYEWFVKQVPGLCIDCVNAVAREENHVEIVVKPKHQERFPQLGRVYQKEILNYLEDRRMLGTTITLKQPKYTPIYIKGRIRIKKTGEDSLQVIEMILKEELDFDKNHMEFGRTISFHKVYERIQNLNFVEFIQDLSASTKEGGCVQGMEIKMDDNSLGYLDGLDIRFIS